MLVVCHNLDHLFHFPCSLSRAAQFGFSRCGVPAFPSWFSITFLKIVVEVMTSGLPQICDLWFGVSNGMLPVLVLAQKILIAVNYCGRQQDRRLVWAAPAYHRKKGAALHPGACKHSLQYDRRLDGCFGVRVGCGI